MGCDLLSWWFLPHPFWKRQVKYVLCRECNNNLYNNPTTNHREIITYNYLLLIKIMHVQSLFCSFCDHKVWHNVGAGDWLCYVIDKYFSRLEGCVAIIPVPVTPHSDVCVCVCCVYFEVHVCICRVYICV